MEPIDPKDANNAATAAILEHRLNDARICLESALNAEAAAGLDCSARASIQVNAAALALSTGDFAAARRHGLQLLGIESMLPDIHVQQCWYVVRQGMIQDRFSQANLAASRLTAGCLAPGVAQSKRAVAITELASLQASNAQPADAVALFDVACQIFEGDGAYQRWLVEALFDQARLCLALARGCAERELGHLQAGAVPKLASEAHYRRQASAALKRAWQYQRLDERRGPFVLSLNVLSEIIEPASRVNQQTLADAQALADQYRGQRMCEPASWSHCELARLHLRNEDPAAAFQAIRAAQYILPTQGFSMAREQLDYHEFLAHRHQGDHRRALIAYQRYAHRHHARREAALQAGHRGTLREAGMRLAAAGRSPRAAVRPPVRRRSADRTSTGATLQPVQAMDRLTQREAEILQLVTQGLNNRRIAEELALSTNTVRNHLASVFRKLKVGTRAQATACSTAIRV